MTSGSLAGSNTRPLKFEGSSPMNSQRMTVLQVLPALESGGVERGVLEVAEALVDAGHRSLVVSAGGRMVRELVDRGSEHFAAPIGVKSPLTLRWVPWLRRLMVQENIDLIDIHSRLPGWIALMAWKSLPPAARPRLISSLHGLHSVSRYSGVMCSGELVIVVSETVRQYVLKNFPHVNTDQLRLIHRGIAAEEYPRGFQPEPNWSLEFFTQFPQLRDKRLLTLAGRMTRLKGHRDFLFLLARLRDASHSVHGLIVGGTDPARMAYYEEICKLVSELGLDQDVTFTGHRSDLKQIYAISQIVLSLSGTPESFGRTVAESLSIGTPVVGYDHGGVSEILAAQFPEGAVPVGNIEQLTARVSRILQCPDEIVIGPNRFEKSATLNRTLQVYTELLHSKRRAAA